MIPGIDTGGGGFSADLGTSATSGDVYSTTNSKQGGLTINKGLPLWALGFGVVGTVILTGVVLWKN